MTSIQLPLDFNTPKLCECGCGQPAPIALHDHKARGHIKGEPIRFVYGHYQSSRKTPKEPKKPRPSAPERFWSRVRKTEDHWLWLGSKTPVGYGRFTIGKQMIYAHAYSYVAFHGPVPGGKEIDHTCNVKLCVNPHHLEAVTHQVNCARRSAYIIATTGHGHALKTHCKAGHELIGDNLYNYVRKDGKAVRQCRNCQRSREQAAYAHKKSTK